MTDLTQLLKILQRVPDLTATDLKKASRAAMYGALIGLGLSLTAVNSETIILGKFWLDVLSGTLGAAAVSMISFLYGLLEVPVADQPKLWDGVDRRDKKDGGDK